MYKVDALLKSLGVWLSVFVGLDKETTTAF